MSKSCLASQQGAYQAFPDWEVKSPPLPRRSNLFRLEPIGIGTAKVESLASYIARLSEAHCVSSHLLLCKVVYPAVGKKTSHYSGSLGFSAKQINGLGSITRMTVTALEQLTYRDDLPYTTMLTWENIFSPSGLLRPRRAWCTACHEERLREGKQLYEPLIWTLEAVSACPWHHERLREVCPQCNHSLPILAPFSYPGYCSRCKGWLGTSAQDVKGDRPTQPPVLKEELARQVSITYSISELLSRAPTLTEPPSHERFVANLVTCIDQAAGGSINYFSIVAGLWSGMVRRLLAGKTKPRLSVLLQICSRLNISLFDLLSKTSNEKVLEKRRTMIERVSPRPQASTPWDELEKKLCLALDEYPPPSLEKVSRRMGYYSARLLNHFPEQCVQIVSRYNGYKNSKHPEPKKIYRVLHAALSEQPAPSLQTVLRRLGCQDTGYYYYSHYPDLCFAIAKRFKNCRNKPFSVDADRGRLQDALVEQPPPPFSKVAKRFGHNREFVRKKFPDLSQAITSRYLYYRAACNKEKADRLRDEIRRAISKITASGLYVSEARVRKHVKKRLASLGRDSLFKQALREIKAEMGLNK